MAGSQSWLYYNSFLILQVLFGFGLFFFHLSYWLGLFYRLWQMQGHSFVHKHMVVGLYLVVLGSKKDFVLIYELLIQRITCIVNVQIAIVNKSKLNHLTFQANSHNSVSCQPISVDILLTSLTSHNLDDTNDVWMFSQTWQPKQCCVRIHGAVWDDLIHRRTGISPRRPGFVSYVKPKVYGIRFVSKKVNKTSSLWKKNNKQIKLTEAKKKKKWYGKSNI